MCGPWSSCFLSRHCAMISEMFGTIRMPNRQIAAIVCLTPDENLEYYTRSARETNGIGNGLRPLAVNGRGLGARRSRHSGRLAAFALWVFASSERRPVET